MTINSKREDDAKGGHISLTVMFETPGADDKTVAVVKESLPELVGGLLEELIESKQWEGKIEQAKKNDRTATREISKHARSELSKRVKDAYETAFNIRTVMVVGISGEAKKRRLRARGATSSDTKKPVVAPSAIWGPSKN